LDWDAAEALSPMGARAHTAGDIDSLVTLVKAAARPGDHVLCMSNGGFGGVHGKLLQALKN
jgi:UDP-N-acetylmuramate: L-alanyl-gamma-D-glutamyl-meso-diaminopimelate ligase